MRTTPCFPDTPRRYAVRHWLALAAILLTLLASSAYAQPAARPAVRSVFVSSSGSGAVADAVRKRLIDRLKKSGEVQVAEDSASADAVLHVSTVIWPTGTVSPNPRSASVVLTNYQGYISAELTGPSHQTLWSYLVTPGRFRMSNIVDDLADHLSERLIDAVKTGIPDTSSPSAAAGAAGVSLRAAGATFPAPLYRKWFESFAEEPGGFAIAYDAIGSVAGLEQLAAGKIDMAASDIQPAQDQTSAGLLHFPTVVGGVVPIYNLPDAGRSLNLTPQILAGIYSGKIRRWNDPRIRESNRGAHLPDAEISVVHRSDGSGTSYAWTSFLAAASPEWKSKVGASVEWPVGTGASGNEGVAEQVAKTPDSIGYVELIYAIQHQLSYAAVENPAGRFIKADLDSITTAAASAASGDHRSYLSALNTAPKNAYPITTFTWLVVPETRGSAQQRAEIAKFLRWMLTTGQKQCEALGYAPLPREIVAGELQTAAGLK